MTLVPLGRLPKPTALRIAEGRRGHRPLPKGEPQPRVGTPEMPDYLPPLAQVCWRRTVEEMSAVPGWLTRADWRMLEGYAIDYAIWRDAIAALKENGLAQLKVWVDSSGQEHTERKSNPELKALNDADVRMKKAEAAFGFSPVFRARISLQPKSEDEDLDLAP
jgi:P27 family predicted phage terminase small subunit